MKIDSVKTEGADEMEFNTNLFNRLSFALGAAAPVTIPLLASAKALLELTKLADTAGYYERLPDYLLRPNDVSISYNPSIGGRNISENFFREGEHLFSGYPANGGSFYIHGQNLSQYAEEFAKEHPADMLDFLEEISSIMYNGPEIFMPPLEELDPYYYNGYML